MPNSSFRFSVRRRASICLNQFADSAHASKCRRILAIAAMFLGIAALGAAPLAAQATNFGSASVGTSTPVTMTVTLTGLSLPVPTDQTISSLSVLTQGSPSLDFTNAGAQTA